MTVVDWLLAPLILFAAVVLILIRIALLVAPFLMAVYGAFSLMEWIERRAGMLVAAPVSLLAASYMFIVAFFATRWVWFTTETVVQAISRWLTIG